MMSGNFRTGLVGIALFGALGAYGAALAQSPPIGAAPTAAASADAPPDAPPNAPPNAPMATTPNTMSATQGATTGLGDSHRFATPAAASAHCSNDTIVWSSRPSLTYSLPNASGYGKGQGFYACKSEADDAGFRPAS